MRKPSLVLLGLVGVLVVIFLAGLQAGLLVLIGIGFGLILQACRFGFTSGWRHFILRREAAGITGQMLLMAVASAVALPLLSLYPTEIFGAVAPISWSLLLGAFVFGVAMQVADGCGSGSLN
ncbi:MAG: YeeE/YedE thiosulfate transporter family protein, partial [Burkholderiaceae bacterium]